MGEINDVVETVDNQRNIIYEKVTEVRTRAPEEDLTCNREDILFHYTRKKGENCC